MAESVSLIQTNFTSGELSERMFGRIDVSQYYNGAKKLLNYIMMPQGGVKRRSGTRFVSETKTSNFTRLLPFVFSTEQAYVLEFGEKYIRFYMNGGLIVKPDSDEPYEVETPYTVDDLKDIWYTQSNDIIYLFHEKYMVRKLSRTGHTDWTLTEMETKDGPFGDLNKSDTKIKVSAKTGTVTITATANLFTQDDVGRLVRILQGTTWASLKITEYTDAKNVKATFQKDFDLKDENSGLTETLFWKLGAWCKNNGYPKCCTFHKERLWAANTPAYPNRYWSSKTNDFETFSTTAQDGEVLDNCGFDAQIADDGVNAINYLTSLKMLVMGTTDGEFLLRQSSSSSALSPTNFIVDPESFYGGSNIKPVRAHSTCIFTQRNNKKLYQYGYDYNRDSYKGIDISLLSEHITRPGIKDMYYAQQPNTLIYTILNDGTIAACTFLPEQKIIAWQRIELGGKDTEVVSVVSIPNAELDYDEVWVIVRRTINGVTKQYVEYFVNNFEIETGVDKTDAFFVDSGLTLNSEDKVTKISGLEHLEGETVSILADGAVQQDRVVKDGSITLTNAAKKIHIGLPYKSQIVTLPVYIDQGQQTLLSKKKMIYKIALYFYDSLGGKYYYEDGTPREIFTRTIYDNMDDSPPLFSGVRTLSFPNNYSSIPSIVIEQEQPLPMNISALSYSMVVAA